MDAVKIISDLSFTIQNIVAGTATVICEKMGVDWLKCSVYCSAVNIPIITLHYPMGSNDESEAVAEMEESTGNGTEFKDTDEASMGDVLRGTTVDESSASGFVKQEKPEMLAVIQESEENLDLFENDSPRVHNVSVKMNSSEPEFTENISNYDPEEPSVTPRSEQGKHERNDEGTRKNQTHKSLERGTTLKKKPFACTYCKKPFMLKGDKKRHEKIHTGENLFKCIECDRSFNRISYLNDHMRTHTNERPFVCDQCGKGFLRLSTLKEHIKRHSDERTFPCDFCEKSFKSKGNLTLHQRTHTGERPYDCHYCGKSFVHSAHRTIHMRLHTGEKPFLCAKCGKSFVSTSDLAKHEKLHPK